MDYSRICLSIRLYVYFARSSRRRRSTYVSGISFSLFSSTDKSVQREREREREKERVIRFVRQHLPSDQLDFARGRRPACTFGSAQNSKSLSIFIETTAIRVYKYLETVERRAQHMHRAHATDRSPYILYELYAVKFKRATPLDGFRISCYEGLTGKPLV